MADIDTIVYVFSLYLGMKLHFDNVDFIYTDSFHERFNENSLDNRKRDVELFIELSSQYQHDLEGLKEKLITLFLTNKKGYITDLFGKKEKFENAHLERMNHINNLTNLISNDVTDLTDYMLTNNKSFNEMVDFKGDRPLLIKKLKLSNEFIALLDSRFNILSQETANPLWGRRKFALQKYKYFIQSNPQIEDLLDNFCLK